MPVDICFCAFNVKNQTAVLVVVPPLMGHCIRGLSVALFSFVRDCYLSTQPFFIFSQAFKQTALTSTHTDHISRPYEAVYSAKVVCY